MADFDTKIRVSVKTQGFDTVQTAATKIATTQTEITKGLARSSAASNAFRASTEKAFKAFDSAKATGSLDDLNAVVKELEDALSGVAVQQLSIQKNLIGLDKGTEEFKQLTAEMKSLDVQSRQIEKSIGLVEKAFRGQSRAAKEAALGMIAQGADCIVPDADAAGQGVYQAVVEKKDQGIKTFGVFVPATDAAPGQVLANYVSNYGQGVTNLAKQVQGPSLRPRMPQ